jgi:hypothetical protein
MRLSTTPLRTLTEGQLVRAEIVREVLVEPGRAKLARCRISDAPLCDGPTLRDRIAGSPYKVVDLMGAGPDRLEQAGWSETLEQASSGVIGFEGGTLVMSLTPAMTLFDVDGDLPPAELALAGASAAARTIRRFAIGGSIGIDLPTIPGRADRQAAAAAVDAILPQPFERTSVNGFGFLQIVRRRARPSLPEMLQADPVGAAARALLRLAERTPGAGERLIRGSPAVAACLDRQPDWLSELARRSGVRVVVEADPALGLAGGHVQGRFA